MSTRKKKKKKKNEEKEAWVGFRRHPIPLIQLVASLS